MDTSSFRKRNYRQDTSGANGADDERIHSVGGGGDERDDLPEAGIRGGGNAGGHGGDVDAADAKIMASSRNVLRHDAVARDGFVGDGRSDSVNEKRGEIFAREISEGNAGGSLNRSLKLTVPYPPSVNTLYVQRGRRKSLSPVHVAYRDDIAVRAIAAMLEDGRKVEPYNVPVRMDMLVYRPRKTGDLDNVFKTLLDGLEGVVFRNDSQVVQIVATRLDDRANPRVEIEVTPIPNWRAK